MFRRVSEGKRLVLHITAGLHRESGGTSRVVVDLTDALGQMDDWAVTLLAQGLSRGATTPSLNQAVVRRVLEPTNALEQRFALPMKRELERIAQTKPPALIHNHGLWMPANHWASHIASRSNISLIIQPHGMLQPWAMQHKGRKKRFALALYQRRDLATAKVLVATADAEYANLRQLGLKQPIAIIPNGVHLPLLDPLGNRPPRVAESRRTVLFLGRIYPVKGLLNLIEAWARLQRNGWQLHIAGPDEAGHLAEVMNLAQRLSVADTVSYLGAVEGEKITALYQQADLFVLPSFTENFGLVVAEALAHGLPVITTQGAPWADLVTFNCGWWIEIGVDPLAEALGKAMALSDSERQAMGARGRDYVRRYDWPDIARKTSEVYRWVLERGGAVPECLRVD